MTAGRSPLSAPSAIVDLAIVGDGFGACAAVGRIAREAAPGLRVALLSRAGGPSRGLAYGAEDPSHLLNVAVTNMGVEPEAPAAFADWLARRGETPATRFAPRATYGRFLEERWAEALTLAEARGVEVRAAPGARRIARLEADGLDVERDDGGTTRARAALIVEGPAAQAPLAPDGPRWIGRPWPDGLARLDPADAHVAIVGAGLTALDAAASALARGAAHVTMISLDARPPRAHPDAQLAPIALGAEDRRPGALLAVVRAAARAGAPWPALVDGLRATIDEAWRGWSTADRLRALRRLGWAWTIHRHRAPAETLEVLRRAEVEGRLTLRAGRVEAVKAEAAGVEVRLAGGEIVEAASGVDARGFAPVRPGVETVCGRALADGLFELADTGFGVVADAAGRAVAPGLAPVHVCGAARWGHLVETTGAPEVRAQVTRATAAILATLAAQGPPSAASACTPRIDFKAFGP